ncbi:MAG: site-specific integrase [Bacteroidota bacterium]
MLQVDIFIDTRRKTKKGFPVKLQIYCTLTKQRKYIHTKTYQNSKTRKTPEAQEALTKLLTRIEPIKELPLNDALPLLKQEGELEILAMEHKLQKHVRFVDFFSFTQALIAEKEVLGMDTNAYKAVMREVKNFEGDKPFSLNDITYSWVNNYILHKTAKGTGKGGISYYLRTLRTIHNEAIRRNIGVKDTKPFKGLITNTRSAEHQSKSWSVDDIRKLMSFKHPNASHKTQSSMKRAIDIFLFQFAIGGHDLVDIANLKWSNIKDGRLKFQRYKNRNKPNGGRWVNNMINEFAQKVIAEHGNRDSERIFDFLGNPETKKYTHRNFGATLKRISEVLRIQPHLTTKTPRYVFRTIAGGLLINDLVLETLLGHKPTSINRVYQQGLPFEVLDREHQKVLDEIFLSYFERLEAKGQWDSKGCL